MDVSARFRVSCRHRYEAMHMIRKGHWATGVDLRKQNQFIDKLFDLPA
jgi:hypothetical protein